MRDKEIMTPEVARLNLAQALAEFAHAGQVDKQGAPYIDHVKRVYSRCRGLSQDQQIAALLHDTVEDKGANFYPVIWHLFGGFVADLVKALTRVEGEKSIKTRDRLRLAIAAGATEKPEE